MPVLPLSMGRLATEDIFSLMGLQNMPDTEKDKILAKLEHTVLARVYGDIISQMEPEDAVQMEELEGEQLMQFIAEKGFDLVQLLQAESIRYRMELAVTFQVLTTPSTIPQPA
jgi:hypothetical protein